MVRQSSGLHKGSPAVAHQCVRWDVVEITSALIFVNKDAGFTRRGVDELDWFAQCPDPNPVKELWDQPEHRLRVGSHRLLSVDQEEVSSVTRG